MKFIIVLVLGIIILIGGIVFIGNFRLFDKEEVLLGKYYSKGFSIEVFEVATGATSNDVIQVRKITENSSYPRIIKNIEGYNQLVQFTIINDSTYKIILNDTGYVKNEPDTFLIKE